MGLLQNLFGSKPIHTNQDFWNWFTKHEKKFFKVVKRGNRIESDFFDKISPKLQELKDGYFYLTGMLDEHTAELIITADGLIRNFIFVEELVKDAPQLPGWKFTAHKPALNIDDVGITMAGQNFSHDNLSFYPTDFPAYPDEIDITVVHDDLNSTNENDIVNGTYIFLDNILGELNFATTIDNLSVIGRDNASDELVPISKLKDYLIWREKEFIEKYEGVWHSTEEDVYSAFEATLESGNPLLAVINMDLLSWDRKASHPWILRVAIRFGPPDVNNGMPDEDSYQALDQIEDRILSVLKDADGFLNIGRQTAEGVRDIYFGCKDFRTPSKLIYTLAPEYRPRLEMTYEIYKDKYWQSFNRFTNQ
jgi:hypothetical protein